MPTWEAHPSNSDPPMSIPQASQRQSLYRRKARKSQGTVTVQATVFGDDFNGFSATDTFVITAPSVTAGITPQTATVPLNSTLQLHVLRRGVNNAVGLDESAVAAPLPAGIVSQPALQSISRGLPVHRTSGDADDRQHSHDHSRLAGRSDEDRILRADPAITPEAGARRVAGLVVPLANLRRPG